MQVLPTKTQTLWSIPSIVITQTIFNQHTKPHH
jgi:hypothetical protein